MSYLRAAQTTLFTLAQAIPIAGEGVLRFQASALGCDWGRRGAESAVVTVTLNGLATAELVLHQGEHPFEYAVALGPLAKGSVLITVQLRPDLSPAGAREIHIEDAVVDVIPPDHSDFVLWRFSPRLYGRADNATSDTPLLLLARYHHEGLYTRVAYAFVWSDQDSDRSVVARMAQDGTPVDIDWVYELYVNRRTGDVPRAVVQGAGQLTDPLRGRLQSGHPVLCTTTHNNMVSPRGSSPLLFALPPVWAYDATQGPRERVLDAFPWAIETATKEIQREGRLAYETFDPRRYLYIDFVAALPPGGLLAAQVTLQNGVQLFSDRGSSALTIIRSGWSRTAILLPSGVGPSQLASVNFIRRDKQKAAHRVERITPFLLDSQYRPQRLTLPVRTATSY